MTGGDIHWVQLPTANGCELQGRRPAVILQDDHYAGELPVVLVVPLTTARATMRFAGTVLIQPAAENGLPQVSVALVFQLRAIDRRRVQVKSSQSSADAVVLRSLQGSMRTFGAEQGLLVCWGGFTRVVLEEARRSFFTVRLWDAGDVLEALFKSYDRLSAALQTELPLKRIWALVAEGE